MTVAYLQTMIDKCKTKALSAYQSKDVYLMEFWNRASEGFQIKLARLQEKF